jgi:hypothetical protein
MREAGQERTNGVRIPQGADPDKDAGAAWTVPVVAMRGMEGSGNLRKLGKRFGRPEKSLLPGKPMSDMGTGC